MRRNCKECPWKNDNPHSLKFREYSEKMNKKHACHMIEKDVWGLKTNIDQNNICIGTLNNNK
jgi:hypothetical protein